METVRLFLSAVSSEFGACRRRLRKELTRPSVDVKEQEDFIVTGTETLDLLDLYIETCDAVVQIVGDMTGAMAQAPSVALIRSRYPDFASRFPRLAPFLDPGGPPLSYTQWEAWLALYHGKRLFVAVPEETAPRDGMCPDAAQKAAQQAHLQRLADEERYPFRFESDDKLLITLLRSPLNEILQSARPARPMMAPDAPHAYDLVGRDDDMAGIRATLLGGGQCFVAVELAPGIGKTALARRIANDAELQAGFPGGVMWANLGKTPDIRNEFHRWAQALRARPAGGESNAPIDGEQYWRSAVRTELERRRLKTLLVVDDVWTLDHGRAFIVGGDSAAYLFTTRFPDIARRLAPRNVVRLSKLDTEQGLALLAQFAPEVVKAYPASARLLVERVDGLPQALILMGGILCYAACTGERDVIRAELAKLQDIRLLFDGKELPEQADEVPPSLSSVIEASYRWLGGSDASPDGEMLRRAIESLAILRPDPSVFTKRLAVRVAGIAPETLSALCRSGLIETREKHVEAPTARPESEELEPEAEPETFYTMHRTISEYLQTKLDSERARELNAAARDHYREELVEIEENFQKKGSAFEQWFRYENKAWGDAQDNWLYHLARSGDDRSATVAFLRAWFDGFWWWGCFLGFHFCDQLLREWQQREIRPESREVLERLARFQQIYPKETEDRHGGNWPKVEAILGEIRARVGIADSAAVPADSDARHLRGLTSIFLAEARRFGARDYEGAERLYRDALRQFIDNKDDWDTAWAYYHLADLLLEAGRPQDAFPLCEPAIKLGGEQQDSEVLANLRRVLGDIALAQNTPEIAIVEYDLAVENAYRYQVYPVAPDPYTIRFYGQIVEQVCSRLVELARRWPDQAIPAMTAICCGWRIGAEDAPAPDLAAAASGGNADVAAAIFPPSLPDAQLATDGEPYARQVWATLDARCARVGAR